AAWTAQPAVRRPLREPDLRHQPRLDPGGIPRRGLFGERRALPSQRREPLRQVVQRRPIEAGADLARVLQPAALVVAQQQRAELLARPARGGVAADHELLLVAALELAPVPRPGADVRTVRALGDQA